ncbi:hypothetical protein [Leptospira sanjuanensis]|uniref:hypothetical protein n=1 Tax=Leptospira sanjuanensis TaxID=2879643 RepID=UPI001EE7E115|nr:hypothetical protein [Leptospira sanjuanensis]MCG6168558.1 hypothetical protein [Leptospira sanjuanensis]
MNYQRLEKIGKISVSIAITQFVLLLVYLYVPGLQNAWIERHFVPVFVSVLLFSGGLFLSTTLGINLIRSGELEISHIFFSSPVPKPLARLIGIAFLLMGAIGVLMGSLTFPFYLKTLFE